MTRLFTILLFVLFALSACTTMYQQSDTVYKGLTLSHNLPEDEIRAITKTVLQDAGYEVREVNGKFMTEPQPMSLSQNEADCGNTLGVYHVDSDATNILVTMTASFEEDTVVFQSDVRGELRKGDPLHGEKFKCESTGAMEREMSAAVRAKVEGEGKAVSNNP